MLIESLKRSFRASDPYGMDSRSWLRALSVAAAASALMGSPSGAQAGEACDTGGGPSSVSLILVASPGKVQAFARATRGQILRKGSDTVVFTDGRVITSNASSATEHLNALGWADRRIEVAASFAPRRRRSAPG